MQKTLKKRFPVVLLCCILGIILCTAGALISTRKVFAEAETTEFTLADYKMTDGTGAVTDMPAMDRYGIDFEGASANWDNGIMYKEQLSGAYSIEFDLMSGVPAYGVALITLGHKNPDVLGTGDQILGTDSVTFALNSGGLISGLDDSVTSSGYTIETDSVFGNDIGFFTEGKTLRFKLEVQESGDIDVYIANVAAAIGVSTPTDFKRFYILKAPATSNGGGDFN